MKNIDEKYNFLIDSLNTTKKNLPMELQNIVDDEIKNVKNRITDCEKITSKKYEDPDKCSQKLYKGMTKFIYKQIENYGLNYKVSTKNKKILFENLSCTTDYIGPSRCERYKNNNLNDQRLKNEIVDILLKTRVLGGHVFWPHEQPSINQYKGKSFKDRIDIILHLIKNNYETPNLLKKNRYRAYDRFNSVINQNFFDLFGEGIRGFENFIEFNCLEDFVDVDNGYKVYNLFESELNRKKKKKVYLKEYNISKKSKYYNVNWETYKNNMISLIEKRNERMWKIINKKIVIEGLFVKNLK